MKVLVTGSTGYLGSRLCIYLSEHGHQVTATGREVRKAEPLIQQGIRFSPCDLLHPNALPLQGQDAVIHCAARSSVWGPFQDFFNDNVLATERLAQKSKDAGVARFVHISTPSIFAALKDRVLLDEKAPPTRKPLNHYAGTKLEAEHRLNQMADQQFQVRILRPQAIVGPGEQAILPRFLRVNQTTGIPVLRGGIAETDLVPVENVLEVIHALLESPSTEASRTYHLSNGDPQRLLELLERMLKAIDVPIRTRPVPYPLLLAYTSAQEAYLQRTACVREPALTRYGLSVLGFSRTLDVSRVQRELGVRPRISIDQCLEEMARWWRDHA